MCGSSRPRASSKRCERGPILAECTLGGGAESSGSRRRSDAAPSYWWSADYNALVRRLVSFERAGMRALADADRIRRFMAALAANVELASPTDFIPVLPGWEDRSPFIIRLGRVSFHHFEFAAHRRWRRSSAAMLRTWRT